MDKDKRYNVTLGPRLDDDLDRIAATLHISKSEVMRRALSLFNHAVEADAVKLRKGTTEQEVLIK